MKKTSEHDRFEVSKRRRMNDYQMIMKSSGQHLKQQQQSKRPRHELEELIRRSNQSK